MADVSFTKKTWADGSSGGTPITASELNRMEQGIKDCADGVNGLGDSISRKADLDSNVSSAVFKALESGSADQPIAIRVASSIGEYSLSVSTRGLSLYDHEKQETIGSINWS